MRRLNVSPVFHLGGMVHAIRFLKGAKIGSGGTTWQDADRILGLARHVLADHLKRDDLKLRASKKPIEELLRYVEAAYTYGNENMKLRGDLDLVNATNLSVASDNLLPIISSEFESLPVYYVDSKGGYDIEKLIERGEEVFSPDLASKVPAAIPDIRAGTRCIAFELPTAAAYHFHRANEAVFREYWTAVSPASQYPAKSSMGGILHKMEQDGIGDPMVISSLKDLTKLHRNPLIHPDQTIETVHEAIALMHAVNAALAQMLKQIHPQPSQPTSR